jgi:CelD/BcsL family acetyltransferase involved in cellulose biosynthesis
LTADAPGLLELTTDVVVDIEGIRALTPDYQHLYEVTGNTLPFALQAWHLAWCDHFLNRHPPIQDQPLFVVLRRSTRECVAIVPLILSRRRLGPLKLGSVALLGVDPGLTEIRTPLIQPGYEWLTVRAVYASLARVNDWDWIQWNGISTALADAMDGEMRPQWQEKSQDYVLDLPPSWEKLRAGLKRNVRESLRHCYNSLRRDGHTFEFIVARDPSEVRLALKRFLELHAMRANTNWGTPHPNQFAGPTLQSFLHSLCERLAARDSVRVFQLRIGNEIVASRIGFAVGNSIYLYYSGFDPTWARHSVMTTTVAETFKYAIANGFKSVNLSIGREQSKLRWRPRLVEFHSAIVHRELLKSRILSRAYRLSISKNGVRLLKNLVWPARDWS